MSEINSSVVRRLGIMRLPGCEVRPVNTFYREAIASIFALEQDEGLKPYLERSTRVEIGIAMAEFLEEHPDKDLIFKLNKTERVDEFTAQRIFRTKVDVLELIKGVESNE